MHQWHQGNFLYVQTYLANKRILILILILILLNIGSIDITFHPHVVLDHQKGPQAPIFTFVLKQAHFHIWR